MELKLPWKMQEPKPTDTCCWIDDADGLTVASFFFRAKNFMPPTDEECLNCPEVTAYAATAVNFHDRLVDQLSQLVEDVGFMLDNGGDESVDWWSVGTEFPAALRKQLSEPEALLKELEG